MCQYGTGRHHTATPWTGVCKLYAAGHIQHAPTIAPDTWTSERVYVTVSQTLCVFWFGEKLVLLCILLTRYHNDPNKSCRTIFRTIFRFFFQKIDIFYWSCNRIWDSYVFDMNEIQISSQIWIQALVSDLIRCLIVAEMKHANGSLITNMHSRKFRMKIILWKWNRYCRWVYYAVTIISAKPDPVFCPNTVRSRPIRRVSIHWAEG
jgi:hypothetical protein